ncbi:MAG: hypothetical protein WAK48_09975 [Candidatus Acidiferrum sp.]|jgi:hypothetical protein
MESRRVFLTGLLVASASGLAGEAIPAIATQSPVIRPPQQPPQNPSSSPSPDNDAPTAPDLDKKILENNEKDMKKKVEQLYQLAKELKDEVEKTDSTKVLSLNLVKKTEEIEKLAHDIRNRSKG